MVGDSVLCMRCDRMHAACSAWHAAHACAKVCMCADAARVTKKDPSHPGAVVVKFSEDGTLAWLPAENVLAWIEVMLRCVPLVLTLYKLRMGAPSCEGSQGLWQRTERRVLLSLTCRIHAACRRRMLGGCRTPSAALRRYLRQRCWPALAAAAGGRQQRRMRQGPAARRMPPAAAPRRARRSRGAYRRPQCPAAMCPSPPSQLLGAAWTRRSVARCSAASSAPARRLQAAGSAAGGRARRPGHASLYGLCWVRRMGLCLVRLLYLLLKRWGNMRCCCRGCGANDLGVLHSLQHLHHIAVALYLLSDGVSCTMRYKAPAGTVLTIGCAASELSA